MSSPDSSNDFSHLPTVDEARTAAGGDSSALWQKHRRDPSHSPATVGKEAAAPGGKIAPEPSPPPDRAAWQSLLDMEVEQPLVEYQRPPKPPAQPAPAPAAAPRKRTVIRAPGQREAEQEQPVIERDAPIASPPPLPPAPAPPKKQKAKKPEPVPEEAPVQEKTPERDKETPSEDLPAKDPAAAPKADVKVELEAPKSPWRHRWEKLGGAALGLSVAIHLLIIGGAALYVVGRVMEPSVDFLPGGGTAQSQAASEALQHKIQQKKNPWLKKSMPIRRLASMANTAEITLPDAPDAFELPEASNQLLNSKLGAGLGLAGAGGGFGKGMGLGSRSGVVFQPLSMFGRQINARRMALVLDVSASMAPHLPRVIEEVDRVAKDSVVVLYVGCGLEAPPPKGLDGKEVFRTSGPEFERFWRLGGATLEESRKFKFNPKDPIPMEEIYRLLSRRPQTYFVHAVGLSYTWLALLSNEVRSADALYWFSDFQDTVNFKQISVVRENLLNRKQKLYIHAYQRGSAFDLVVSQLVQPTNGDVIEAEP